MAGGKAGWLAATPSNWQLDGLQNGARAEVLSRLQFFHRDTFWKAIIIVLLDSYNVTSESCQPQALTHHLPLYIPRCSGWAVPPWRSARGEPAKALLSLPGPLDSTPGPCTPARMIARTPARMTVFRAASRAGAFALQLDEF